MEAQRLPQEILFQAIENFQELARERIGRVVTAAVKRLVEGLLGEELARNLVRSPTNAPKLSVAPGAVLRQGRGEGKRTG